MFGVSVDEATHHYETIIRVVEAAIHYTHWPSFAMGVFSFIIMYELRWFNPRIPNVLVDAVVTTVLSFLAGILFQWKKMSRFQETSAAGSHSKHDETYMFWIRIGKISLTFLLQQKRKNSRVIVENHCHCWIVL
jgi:MFS superfamily sulfate permease-like transporter